MGNTIILIIDHEGGAISMHSRELVSAARALSSHLESPICAVMAGHETSVAAESFAAETGMDVHLIEHENLLHYSAEAGLNVFSGFIARRDPRLVLVAHNPRGCDFAPALAVRLGYACISGVEEFRPVPAGLTAIRSAWHGKVREEVSLGAAPAILLVMPGAFSASLDIPESSGFCTVESAEVTLKHTLYTGSLPSGTENAALSSAEVVIAAGRGLKKIESMELLDSLRDLFPRSALGGSRGACDLGLVDYSSQVGITGKTVAPKLYMAFGISGASQHTAGMKNSRHIIAINSDPGAPIFSISQLGIVDDLTSFIPAFLETVKKHRS